MNKFAPLLIAFLTSLVFAQARDESEIVLVGTKDPDMVAAIQQARSQLDEFLRLAADPPHETSGYKLKVVVRDGDTNEHFWITPFRPTKSGFAGILSNEPKLVRNVRGGQMVQFTRNEISDWGYVRSGRQVGSFTVCALFKKMPKQQVEYYRNNHGFDC